MDGTCSGLEAGVEMMQNEPVDSDLVTRAKAAKELTKEAWAEVLGTNIGAFPSWFANRKQFGVWGRCAKAGVKKKSLGRFPDGSFDTGPNKDDADGTSWMTLSEAAEIKPNQVISGLKVVGCTFLGTTFTNKDGVTWRDAVIDMDGVRDPETREWTPLARDVIEEAQSLGAWCEISPSGTGAKIFGKVRAVGESTKQTLNLPDGSGVEVFIGRKGHLCLTGVPCDPNATVGDSLPDLSQLVKRLEAAAVNKPGASNAQPVLDVPQGGGGGDSQGRSTPQWFNDELDLWGLMSADGWTKGKPASKGGWLMTRPAKDLGAGCSGVLTGDGKRLINWSSNANVTTDSQGCDSFGYWCQQRGWDCADRQVLKTVENWLKTGPLGSPPTVLDTDREPGAITEEEAPALAGWELEAGGNGISPPNLGGTPRPWKPYPLEVLPDLEREFVMALVESMSPGTDPAWAGPAVVSVMGGSIGMARIGSPQPDWTEALSSWLGVIAESGAMKSTILSKITRPLWAIHKRLKKEFESATAKYLTENGLYEDRQDNDRAIAKAKDKAEKLGKSKPKPKLKPEDEGDIGDGVPDAEASGKPEPRDEGDSGKPESEGKLFFDASMMDMGPPVRPIERRNLVVNCTIQKLKKILSENPKGLVVYFDELKGLFDSMVRYAAQGGNEWASWLPMDSGEPILDDTISRGTDFIERAFAVVLGCIQPGVFAKLLTADFMDAGGLARFTLVMPPLIDEVLRKKAMPEAVREGYDKHIEAMFNLCMGGTDENPEPEMIKLPEAGPAYETFSKWFVPHVKTMGATKGHWRSYLSKMKGECFRFATILCVSDRVQRGHGGDCSPIEERRVRAGCTLADWHIYENARVLEVLSQGDAANPGKPAKRTLIEKVSTALRAAGTAGLTKTQLFGVVGKATPKGALDDALKSLGESGIAEQVPCPSGSNRPTELWRAKGV